MKDRRYIRRPEGQEIYTANLNTVRATDAEPLKADDSWMRSHKLKAFASPDATTYTKIEYVNTTDSDILVSDVFGVLRRIPPVGASLTAQRAPRPHGGEIRIRFSFTYMVGEAESISEFYQGRGSNHPIFTLLANLDMKTNTTRESEMREAQVEVSVAWDEFSGDKPIYIEDLGMVVGALVHTEVMNNPYSLVRTSVLRSMYWDDCDNPTTDPGFVVIRAYSRTANYLDYVYVKNFGKVQRIPVEYDSTKDKHGIEMLFRTQYDESSGEVVAGRAIMLSFDEARDKYGICGSLSETLNFDESRANELAMTNKIREMELKERELKAKLKEVDSKMEAMEFKHRIDTEKAERDKREAEERYEREKEEFHRKQYREEKKQDRDEKFDTKKQIFDIAKTVLSVIGAVFTAVWGIMKLMPKPA